MVVHANRVFVLEEQQFNMRREGALFAMTARMASISRGLPALPLARMRFSCEHLILRLRRPRLLRACRLCDQCQTWGVEAG